MFTVALASPASADPTGSFVAGGSDTIQDVENAFAAPTGIGGGLLASFDAVDPGTQATHGFIKVKPGTNPIVRPNGSGDGLLSLEASHGTETSGSWITATGATDTTANHVTLNTVDIARSSSGPSSSRGGGLGTGTGAIASSSVADTANLGQEVYIPFALDAVSFATSPATTIADANGFSLFDLGQLFTKCQPVTVGANTYTPATYNAGTNTFTGGNIHLYAPQAGSGTAKFFTSVLPPDKLSDNYGTCVSRQVTVAGNGVVAGGIAEENHGAVVANDPAGLFPFSVAQWIAQGNATVNKITDNRAGAIIHSIDPSLTATHSTAVAPTVTGVLNTAFPITREVYNVITKAQLNTNAKLRALLYTAADPAASGTPSLLCSQGTVIAQYGFATLDSKPKGHWCGEVSFDNSDFHGGTY